MHYTNLMSHPDKFLEDHLENVADFSKSSFLSLIFENNDKFADIAYLIGICHDFAKSTTYFQNYLLENKKNQNTPHSFLSAIFTYYVVNQHIKNENLTFADNLDIIAYIAVLFHHGNIKSVHKLMDYHDNKIESRIIRNQIGDLNDNDGLYDYYLNKNIDLSVFLNDFDEICDEISERLFDFEYGDDFNNYFNILLFYSVLLDADKMDASGSEFIKRHEIPKDIVDEYKINHNFNLEGINKIREEAYVEVSNNIKKLNLDNRILSINLPTGIGKTLTGLSAVLELKDRINKEMSINPRIIYSLPFLSVIDQNEEVIRDIFDENNLSGNDYLLKHNHLANMSYLNNETDEEYDISNSKILIEGWNSEFIITTFIQFFYSLIGNKNSFLRKFHNITNSIIILDEIQSVPHKYWGIINSVLKKLAYDYNCWIILMTATQPFIFKENEIMSLVDNVDNYFNHFDRIQYNFNLEDITISEFNDTLIEVIESEKNKDIMVVLNTIASSSEIYKSIKQYFIDWGEDLIVDDNGICHVGDDINLIYLSTNILPYHRLNKINYIRNSKNQNIIISTQLIEAGVDIDVDIIYRDFAPLDSIIQTAGRCNRSGKKDKGSVNVISLVNDKGKRFSSFVYHSLLLNITNEVIGQVKCCCEKNFNLRASQKYFKKISQRNFDDEELIEILNYLRFEDIPSKFKLIKNSLNKIDVFICINDESETVFNEYKRIIYELSGFERKNAFLKIKSKFYKYVISVDEKKFGSANLFNDEIGIVYPEDLKRKYHADLGFVMLDDEEPMIW